MNYKVRIASKHPSHREMYNLGQLPKFKVRVRVRFGSTKDLRACDIDFNTIEAINNTANKIVMKDKFLIADIDSPLYFENDEAGREAIKRGMLGEKIFFKIPFHSRGRGMVVYNTKEEALEQTAKGYFEQAQVSKREFRVHVMDGKVFCIDEKRPRDTSIRVEDRPEIKNMDSGFKFRRPMKSYPPEVESESIKAVEALGLDFGAADVGLNDEGVWIYEVNTAPSLRTKTRKLYQKALVALIYKKILSQDVEKSVGELKEEVERLSRQYDNWLDEQPLTD